MYVQILIGLCPTLTYICTHFRLLVQAEVKVGIRQVEDTFKAKASSMTSAWGQLHYTFEFLLSCCCYNTGQNSGFFPHSIYFFLHSILRSNFRLEIPLGIFTQITKEYFLSIPLKNGQGYCPVIFCY